MCRKLLFLTSLILVLSLLPTNPVVADIIDIRITDGGDDAEQHLDDNRMDITSSDLELPYEDGGDPTTDEQVIGLRFQGVALEADALVGDAYIEIEVDKVNKEGSLAPVNLIIEGELALDAAAFEDVAGNITDRPTTAAKVKWSIPEWTEQDAKFQSPDISSIIKEIISQEGWASGNAIVLIIRDDKDNPSTGLREAESYDGEADAAPLLRITLASAIDIRVADGADDAEEHLNDNRMDVTSSDLEIPYEDGGSPASDEQATGIRFQELPMDRGGKVVSAYVEFEIDELKEGSDAPVDVIIKGELAANAAAFEETAGNVSGRATTAAQVKWSIPAGLAVNDKTQTPDISAVIQEIVDQEGWESGNAIVLIITDDKDNPSTGLRACESYDGEPDAAPLLHIVGTMSIVRAATEPVPADGTVGLSTAPVLSTFASTDVPKNIPDWSATTSKNTDGEVASTLEVSDSITIKDINIELNITKPGNNADLNAFLKSPDGKEIKLFDDVGFNRPSNFKNTILDDEAGSSITSAGGPFTGIYKPEGKLSDFDGRNTAGTWRLKVIDDWPGGAGRIDSWRIVVENPIMVSWIPGFDAASQDVYFSSSFEDVNDGAALLGSVAGDAGSIEVGALENGTTYYWRVDTVGSDGTVYPSEIWSFSTALGNVAVNQRVSNGDDDIEEHLPNGNMDITSSDLEMPYENTGQGNPQLVGIRIADVGVPAGAQIIESYLEFEVDETKGGTEPVNLLIGAELSPDAEAFTTDAGNISSRTPAETLVPWSVPDWTAADVKYQTPDITPLIEELIGQEGWAGGNAMAFIIQDDPCNPSLGVRGAESYDGEPTAAPLLHIAGTTEAASNPSPANGMVDKVQETVLSWSPGFTGVSRTVYFGTENPPAKLEATTGTTLDVGKLATSTTYYWRVDEMDASGKKHTGAVWSFTTVIGEATSPDPADGAEDVALDAVLSWTPGATAVSSDVYFGEGDALDFMGNQEENTFDPNGLKVGRTYSWRIDSIEADGTKHVGDVWTFIALNGRASNPDPADGALLEQTFALLTWTAGLSADSYDVYISDNLDDVAASAETAFIGNQMETNLSIGLPGLPFPDGLAGATYYWRIDSVEVDREMVHEGDIWSFTVPPVTAYDPSPADGATDVAVDAQLSWSAGLGAKLHSVYFGDDLDTVTNATGAAPLPLTSFDPGLLEEGKTYYWRVDEFNPPTTVTGQVWSFTTVAPPEPEPAPEPEPEPAP